MTSVVTIYDSDDLHLRSLLVKPDQIVIGTVGEGRILSLRAERDGSLEGRTLFDASQPEITALAAGPEGSIFAAAVASEASLAQLAPPTDEVSEETKATPTAVGTRPSGFEGARSVVLRIGGDGSVDTLGSFEKETVYSLLWLPERSKGAAPRAVRDDERDDQEGSAAGAGESVGAGEDMSGGVLWVATGQDGKLYRSRGDEMILERDLDELQLITLMPGPAGVSVATTNGAALYRTAETSLETGTFSSKILDAKFPAEFGTLHFEAEQPRGTSIGFEARSGLSAVPDETWSDWVELDSPLYLRSGTDIAIDKTPRGRYLQFRATLSGSKGSTPELSAVEVSYRQENRRPEIKSLEVLAPGVVLVSGSFNPANQVFEPTSPNRDGIFSTLDKPAEDSSRPKELWKLGYRTLRWEASDPNNDPLEFTLEVRRDDDQRWLMIAEEVDKTSWGFDSTVLPDGIYRFRLRASDLRVHDSDRARSTEQLTGPVVIDHSPPRVSEDPAGKPRRWIVEDDASPLRVVEISVNAKDWEPLRSTDGMVDSRREVFEVPPGAEDDLILLRLSDAAFNSITVRVDAARDRSEK